MNKTEYNEKMEIVEKLAEKHPYLINARSIYLIDKLKNKLKKHPELVTDSSTKIFKKIEKMYQINLKLGA